MRRTICRLAFRRCASRLPTLGTSTTVGSVAISIRAQNAQSGGGVGGVGFDRNAETFLSQYEPLDVLMLTETAQRSDVEEAYKRLSSEYGPQGKRPDAKKLELVQHAFEILKDSRSIYYTRALAREDHKHRLSYQFLDDGTRRVTQIKGFFAFLILCAVVFGTLGMAFQPMKKIQRAALQR